MSLHLTIKAEQHRKPIVCLVRFADEAKAVHRPTRNATGPAYGPGVTLDVLRDRTWTRAEILAVEHAAIVVKV